MRQSDGPNIEAVIRLAELKGALRKELSIVAESIGLSARDAAAGMGITGLYDSQGRIGVQHRTDIVQALRPGDPTLSLVNGSEAPVAGSAPGNVSPHRVKKAAAAAGKTDLDKKVGRGHPGLQAAYWKKNFPTMALRAAEVQRRLKVGRANKKKAERAARKADNKLTAAKASAAAPKPKSHHKKAPKDSMSNAQRIVQSVLSQPVAASA